MAAPGGVGLGCRVREVCAGCACEGEAAGVLEVSFDLGWIPRSLYNPEPGLTFFSVDLLVGVVDSADVGSSIVRLPTSAFKSEETVVSSSDVAFVGLDVGLATLRAAPKSPPGRGSFFSRGLGGVEVVGEDVAFGVDEEEEGGAGGRVVGADVTVC